jgi:hypothetical protein
VDRRWRASRSRASARSCITRPNHGSPASRRTTAIREPPALLGRCQISVLVRRRWARLAVDEPLGRNHRRGRAGATNGGGG